MDFLTICLLSVALAMDCFAVSLTRGTVTRQWRWAPLLFMALSFGVFQGCMPLVGYAVGYSFASLIDDYDHWVAFVLLAFIGGKMIWEDLRGGDSGEAVPGGGYTFKRVIVLSVATSIDALATGLLFLPYPDQLGVGSFIIGAGSTLLSLLGCFVGYQLGKRVNFRFGVLGGVILIGIGLKILLGHLLQ